MIRKWAITMRAGTAAQRAHIESEARRLARSGKHSDWQSIETALLTQNRFNEVPRVFANAWTRSELDRLALGPVVHLGHVPLGASLLRLISLS